MTPAEVVLLPHLVQTVLVHHQSPWPLPSSPGHCGHSFSLCSTKMVLGVGSESGARRLDQNKIYLYYYPFNLPYDL